MLQATVCALASEKVPRQMEAFNRSFICPSPLVYATQSAANGYVIWAFEEGDCALRCPSTTYTVEEWEDYSQILTNVGFVTIFVSLAAIALSISQYDIFFPKLMFMAGTLFDGT
jgi:hypothetical protein